MGRWKAWALAGLLAATLSALLLQALSARGDELLINGGFEDGVTLWTAIGQGQLDSVRQPTHEGQFAARVTATGPGVKRIFQLVPVTGGGEYEFAGWVLKDDPRIERVYLTIEWCRSDQGALDCSPDGDASLQWVTLDSEAYQPITTGPVIGRVAADTARLSIVIEPASTAPDIEGATVYLDDFSFTGPPAPTPTPTPSPTPPPTQTPPPTAAPLPTVAPTATQMPTPKPSTPSPSPTATSQAATPLPVAGLVNAAALRRQTVRGDPSPGRSMAASCPAAAPPGERGSTLPPSPAERPPPSGPSRRWPWKGARPTFSAATP